VGNFRNTAKLLMRIPQGLAARGEPALEHPPAERLFKCLETQVQCAHRDAQVRRNIMRRQLATMQILPGKSEHGFELQFRLQTTHRNLGSTDERQQVAEV